ncbi:MAG TPA: DUF4232 domain-containing protein [Candidatus Avipropionibacterium avicola]|uniref:DUF4232 domain-containing protein n=1 Tax=Candidatus Avipropionibacterium avicola TaxID=2840701 RepID=A0A9D1GYV2_9ACTN|nr:DUF4232 domain-containing protein [Candidatus Avipropionibacterium avicola]
MNDDLGPEDLGDDLGERLRNHATTQGSGADLAGRSIRQARGLRRRRAVAAAVTAVAVVAVGIGGAGALGVLDPRPQQSVPVANSPHTSATSPIERVPSSSPTAPSDPPTTSEQSDPPPPSPDHSDPPPSTPTQPDSPQTSQSPPPRKVAACTVDTSSVAMGRVQGAAGHVEYAIVLTNTSDQPCTVYGYPGVSIVSGDDGHQVGVPADKDAETAPKTVTVEAGGTATSVLLVAQADAYGDECEPEDGRGFRIYIPEEKRAQFVEMDVTGCTNEEIVLMQVRPFVAG